MPGKHEKSSPDVRETWENRGRTLLQRDSDASWAVAEWIHEGTAEHGMTIPWIVAQYDISRSRCYRYQRAALMFPAADRFELSFSHHLAVINLEPETAVGMLRAAEVTGQSVRELKDAADKVSEQGEIEKLRKENEKLRRKLKAANERVAAETVDRAVGRFNDALKSANRDYRQAAGIIEELEDGGLLEAIHGNRRLGVIREIERAVNNSGRKNEIEIERISSVLDRFRTPSRTEE